MAALRPVLPAAGHRYHVFALLGRDIVPFDGGGAAFGFRLLGLTCSTRAGRAPLVLVQLLLLALPLLLTLAKLAAVLEIAL